jgi:hypothetical protein
MFLLTANSEGKFKEDDEWAGFVTSVRSFVSLENSNLLSTVLELLKVKETTLT